MTRIRSPSCHSVSVKWQQLSRAAPEPLQAPATVPSLFHNDRLLVYGFIPHCTQVRRRRAPYTVGKKDGEFCCCSPPHPHPFPSSWHRSPPLDARPGKLWISLGRGGVARRAAVTLRHGGSRNTNRAVCFSRFRQLYAHSSKRKNFAQWCQLQSFRRRLGR